jgi:hypothetical protein
MRHLLFICQKDTLKRLYSSGGLDGIDSGTLIQLIDNYTKTRSLYKDINDSLMEKKLRMPNFPEAISEKIAQLAIHHHYNIYPSLEISGGDLFIPSSDKYDKIEVKAFTSEGPTSFGPSESWKYIYFIDATHLSEFKAKVYEFRYGNNSQEWLNLPVSKSNTFQDHISQKRRPRIPFSVISKLPHYCIFDGDISILLK